MKTLTHWAANGIFILHICVGIFFLVGWKFESIERLYLPLLVAWPLSWVFLGYCPLTKWELLLRKIGNPEVDTNAEAIQYNVRKYLGIFLPSRPIFVGGIIVFFILFSLALVPDLF